MTPNRDTIDGLREFAESLKSGDLSRHRITRVTIDESGNYVRRVLEPAESASTDTNKETAE